MKASIIGLSSLVLLGVLWLAISGNADPEAEPDTTVVDRSERTPLVPVAENRFSKVISPNPERSTGDQSPPVDSNNDPTDEEIVLAEEKQKLIWDAEHVTFELETYFGKSLQKAIRNRSRDQLAEFFRDQPQVKLIALGQGESRSAATVDEVRVDDVEPAPADVTALIDLLVESAESVGEITRTKLRVLQLQKEEESDDHWTAKILLALEGKGPDGQPRTVQSHHRLQIVFQDDQQIRDGKIVAEWIDLDRSIRQSKSTLMEEATYQVGLDEAPLPDNWKLEVDQRSQYWFQIAVEDYNRDGYPDIAAATIDGRPLLLKSNAGKGFVDVTDQMRFERWDPQNMRALATWIDFDNDGWSDLLLGEHLYQNIEGKMFLDATEQSGLQFGHFPMSTAVADYDCDGLLDLYVLYQHEQQTANDQAMPWVGDTESGAPNQLWKNLGGGRFQDVTEESNASGGNRHSFAAVWHFLDDDRYPDLYVANDFGQNVHLRNRGDGTFEDLSQQLATADFATSMGVTTGDLNNDGKPELYVANMFSKMGRRIIGNVCEEDYPEGIFEQIQGSCAGNRLYTLAPSASSFDEISEPAGVNEVGWAYAPTLADFDSDGLLDIYATTGFMSFQRGKPDG